MKKGFTLLETLISLSILAILLTIALWYFKGATGTEALKKDRQGLVAILEEARSLSLSSKEADVYGVRVEASQATLFKGDVYNTTADNKIHQFNSAVQASSYSLNGGGRDIVFSRLTGSTENFGIVTLSLTREPLSSTTVTVKSTGVIE
jgi:prepilin-type N-terminal cleavage/methylation domain-containing protein